MAQDNVDKVGYWFLLIENRTFIRIMCWAGNAPRFLVRVFDPCLYVGHRHYDVRVPPSS